MDLRKALGQVAAGTLSRIHGGIRPKELKRTAASMIEVLPPPYLITLPLERHLGRGGRLLVRVGDHVKAGQRLTEPQDPNLVPLHASISGEVTAIGAQELAHPSGFTEQCVTIKSDGKDEAVEPAPLPNWESLPREELLARIRGMGVEGLGGAQFQTERKLRYAIAAPVEGGIFIANGAECEPMVTCDDRLMQERAADIALGMRIIRHVLGSSECVIAIEDNKPAAIAAMREALQDAGRVVAIPTLYPSGASRNLIRIVTGLEIPYGVHTTSVGVVVDNVGTVLAVKEAVVDGLPLTRRVITVDGECLGGRGNAWVRLGASVRSVLSHYHLNPERRQRIILGGPMMGFTLPSIDVPITKSATCIIAPSATELPPDPPSTNCVRCGRCARACPSRLEPYRIYAFSRAKDHAHARECGVLDCTLCGCCSFTCPSKLPLAAQFRYELAAQRALIDKSRRAERARERMAAHEARVAEEQRVR
ncbi:MAG: electron transport complex subunit RsxC, partial [Succinivibrionaceae bacterium]|nr:electron transport complex subunit RsxC [Succinivibrionaceae bacterium]